MKQRVRLHGIGKRVVAAMASAALVLGLMPAVALAADAGDEADLAAGSAALETQSGFAGDFTVNENQTGLGATSVQNNGGYASVTYEDNGPSNEPLQALVDKGGNAVFPYVRSWTGYVYWDGIVVQKFIGTRNVDNYFWFPCRTGDVKTGFYNLDGTEAFESGYDQIRNIGDGYAVVLNAPDYDKLYNGNETSECYVIDRMGNKVITLPKTFCTIAYAYQTTSDGKCMFAQYESNLGAMRDGLMGFSSSTITFENTIYEGTSLGAASGTWRHGSMDASGKVVIPQDTTDYDNMSPYYEGLAGAVKWENGTGDGKLGFIDKDHDVVIPPEYRVSGLTDVRGFSDGMVAVCKDGSWGYINRENQTVVPFEYEDAYSASDGLCPVKKDGKYGLVDYDNNVVVPFEYDDITTYEGGVVYAVQGEELVILTIQDNSLAGVSRLQGDIALDTMAKIVEEGEFAGNGTVVLSTVDGYWDALTAAGIAGMSHAPVLMTDGSQLSAQTQAIIEDLSPKRVIVCGGALAVSEDVANAAAAAAGGAEVVRCSGENAVGTAIDIFDKAMDTTKGSWARTAFVCTNDGYWDALAAAPLSYSKNMPIMLTSGRDAISDEVLDAMSGKIDQVYIVGGTAAVSGDVESRIEDAGFKVAGRLQGETAIETSEAVASFGLQFGMTADHMGVATVNGYWDALSGAALCGKKGSVLVLVNGTDSHSIGGFIKDHADDISGVYLFGGNLAIDADTSKAIADAI